MVTCIFTDPFLDSESQGPRSPHGIILTSNKDWARDCSSKSQAVVQVTTVSSSQPVNDTYPNGLNYRQEADIVVKPPKNLHLETMHHYPL
jgi:hypothetical protein